MSITINLSRERFNSLTFVLFAAWAGTFALAASILNVFVQPADAILSLIIAFAVTGLAASTLVLPLGLRQFTLERQKTTKPRFRPAAAHGRNRERNTLVGNPGRGKRQRSAHQTSAA